MRFGVRQESLSIFFFAPNRRCDLVYLRFGVRVCIAAVPRVNVNKEGTEFIELL
jgi:hypothetical protein